MRIRHLIAAGIVAACSSNAYSAFTGLTGGGQAHSNVQPSLGLNYILHINATGFGNVGEVSLFAGDFAPSGWIMPRGQLMSIAQNAALFAKLGDTYGGNGQTSFA